MTEQAQQQLKDILLVLTLTIHAYIDDIDESWRNEMFKKIDALLSELNKTKP